MIDDKNCVLVFILVMCVVFSVCVSDEIVFLCVELWIVNFEIMGL